MKYRVTKTQTIVTVYELDASSEEEAEEKFRDDPDNEVDYHNDTGIDIEQIEE